MLKSRRVWGFVSLVLLALLVSSTALGNIARENHSRMEKRDRESEAPGERVKGENGVFFMDGLLKGVRIHSPLNDEINDLYLRNKAEIHRMVDRNPAIVWGVVEIVMELLPALRSADERGGKLSVDKNLYSRATSLFAQCQSLASPQLADDLKKAKALVESRTTELDSHQLQIDLNE